MEVGLAIPRSLRLPEYFPGKEGKARDTILEPLGNHYDAAKVECVMKNGQLQSVATVMAPFARSRIGDAICPAP